MSGGVLRSIVIRMAVDQSKAVSGVKELEGQVVRSSGNMSRAVRGHAVDWDRTSDRIERGSKRVAIAGAVTLAAGEKVIVGFDRQMSAVNAATHANEQQMDRYRKAAIKAGADSQYSATEAAGAIEQLAKAGVDATDILGGGLTGALSLAAAGQLDVGDAAEYMATTLTQFQLEGSKATHVADLLAAGAGKAQGEVSDMALALGYAGVPAAQLGVSVEELAGTIALLAKNGIVGEKAGTSLRGMIASLTSPSDKARKTMKNLGIDVFDAKGKFVGLDGVAQQLHKRLSGLTQEERANALGRIFGNEQLQAANVLYREGAKGVHQWTKNVNDSGYAADTAARKTDNLAGDWERFTGALESGVLSAGSGAQEGLRDLVKGAEHLVEEFGKLPKSVQSNVVKGVAALTATGGLLWALTKVRKGLISIRELVPTKNALTAAASPGKSLSKATGVVPVYVTNLGKGGLPGGVPDVPAKGGGSAVTRAAVASSVAGSVGQAAAAGAIGTYLVHELSKRLAPSETKAGRFGSVPAAGGGGGMGFSGNDTAFGRDLTASIRADEAREAAREAAKLAAAAKEGALWWKVGYDTVSRINPAIGKYSKVLATVPKEIRSYVSTPGAALSVASMRRLRQQYHLTPKQVRTIMQLQGFSRVQQEIVVAGKGFSSLPKRVRTLLRAEGSINSIADVRRLQARYNLTPKQVRTVMQVSGVEAQSAKVRALQREIAGVRSKSVTIETVIARRQAGDNRIAVKRAGGGQVVASGSQSRGAVADSIDARLSHREWVMPVETVDWYGEDAMRRLQMREAPRGFAGGGQAGAALSVRPTRAGAGYVDLAGALRGISITGTVDGPFGPQQLRGIILDVVGEADDTRGMRERARR